ncbi:ZINC/IRON TRANSPORTER [Salix koriyanagi]|uniref:ZINC/IRON TRANSPORTER n=1 Tax=Salix koriyanagi TaxID=2511006 RepID=A0A9Q1ALN2_9ROSI|nr:ZINC/IRON TRANSPORTER [Salix koriyanagi]
MSRSLVFLSLFLSLLLLTAGHSGHNDDADADADAEKIDLRSKSLILVKIWCLILIFTGTFIAGVSPYFLKWKEGFLVLGTQFASGVFLATALMHFLSDANETFEHLTSKEYPFAFMLACAGYLLTMLADSIISHVYSKDVVSQVNGDDVELQGGVLQGKKKPQQHFTFEFSDAQWYRWCGIAIGVAETEADAWRALWTITLHKIFAAIAMGIALLRMIPDRPFVSCVAYAFAFAISSPIGVAIGIIIDATTQGAVADWIFAISMGLACGVFIYVSIKHLSTKGYFPQKPVLVDTPFYKFLALSLGVVVIAIVMIWD